jgi:hypothetical protein
MAFFAVVHPTNTRSQEVVGTSFRLIDNNGNTLATLQSNGNGVTFKIGADGGTSVSVFAGTIAASVLITGYHRSISISSDAGQSSSIYISTLGENGTRQTRVSAMLPPTGNPRVELFDEAGQRIGGIP